MIELNNVVYIFVYRPQTPNTQFNNNYDSLKHFKRFSFHLKLIFQSQNKHARIKNLFKYSHHNNFEEFSVSKTENNASMVYYYRILMNAVFFFISIKLILLFFENYPIDVEPFDEKLIPFFYSNEQSTKS